MNERTAEELASEDDAVAHDEFGVPEEPSQHDPGRYGELPPPQTSADERRADIERWVSWGVVVFCALFVLGSLQPQLIFQNSTPTGGDMGAHVWGPRYLADHLIPDFRVTGWTPDWYAGFPAYVFYMVVPSLFIVWLQAGPSIWLALPLLALVVAGVVLARRRWTHRWARIAIWGVGVFLAVLVVPIPYNVAFKLVAVSGLVTLPAAAYALGRAARVPFPGPAMLALATLPFIYDRSFTILGGNGASTMAGEFAFSISLTFAFLFLAVAFRGMRTGRDRVLGAVLAALTILCHLIPAIFAGIAVLILLFVRREDRTPWWDRNTAGRAVAGALVVLTLLVVMPDVDLPFGLTLGSPLPQWMFPAVASIVALALFTGLAPKLVPWWRTGIGAGVGVGLLGLLTILLVARPTWWSVAIILVVLGVAFFAGWDDRLARWLILIGPVGIALTAFWSLPFLANSTYMNDMGWEKYTRYKEYLLNDSTLDTGGMPYRNIVFALAGLGIVLAIVHRVRLGWWLSLVVVAFAWIFRFFPQYRLWNARLLPFLYLTLYLLAGLAVALALRSLAIALSELSRDRREPLSVGVAGLGVAVLVIAVTMLASFRILPGGETVPDPADSSRSLYRWPKGPDWLSFDFQTGIVPDWARWNFEGLENKDAWPELEGIVDTMERVADEHGCGRAMWEYEPDLNRFGTPMALMLLPYFTDGCIGSMEGLYFESSTTTPFHFLNQSALSQQPSRAQRDMPYTPFDIDLGVRQLQMLGVRYYMATTDASITAARGHESLTELATETFASAPNDQGVTQRTWAVFEVEGAELVSPLENDPVVLEGVDDHIDGWVYAGSHPPPTEAQPRPPKEPGPAVEWFQDPTRWDTHLATSGPADWPRAEPGDAELPEQSNPEVRVSEVEVTDDAISFRVDRTGEPVLVRTSYFPNWKVDGAEGPYRVSPNFMVVVPTQEQVTLSYGYAAPDLLGYGGTFVGLVGLAWLGVLDLRARRRAEDGEPVDELPEEPHLTSA